jgi:anti-sigma factor ChrR (cupin superfamily)
MQFAHYAPGTRFVEDAHPGGEEVFVVDGSIADKNGHYPKGTWFRYRVASSHTPFSDEGWLLYVKVGHLTAEELGREQT